MNRYGERVRTEWRRTGRGNIEGESGAKETGMVWAGWRKETA